MEDIGITVPITNPAEQLSTLKEGDTFTLEYGTIRVEKVISRNDRHHFSVRGRWDDSGRYCEFSLTQIMKHSPETVTVRPQE